MCVYVCMCMCVYVGMCACVCVCRYVYVCVCVLKKTGWIHAWIHTSVCRYMYVGVHTVLSLMHVPGAQRCLAVAGSGVVVPGHPQPQSASDTGDIHACLVHLHTGAWT